MTRVQTGIATAQSQLLAANQYSQGLVEAAAKAEGSTPLGSHQPASHRVAPVAATTTEEKLFGVSAEAKVMTAHVSMHLKPNWRKRIFQQLDFLLSAANWDALSVMPSLEAFGSFLRTVINYGDLKAPYLGITKAGNIRAAWREPAFELSCEFFPTDRVRFLLKYSVNGKAESLAWDGPVERLRAVLEQQQLIQGLPHAQG